MCYNVFTTNGPTICFGIRDSKMEGVPAKILARATLSLGGLQGLIN